MLPIEHGITCPKEGGCPTKTIPLTSKTQERNGDVGRGPWLAPALITYPPAGPMQVQLLSLPVPRHKVESVGSRVQVACLISSCVPPPLTHPPSISPPNSSKLGHGQLSSEIPTPPNGEPRGIQVAGTRPPSSSGCLLSYHMYLFKGYVDILPSTHPPGGRHAFVKSF